MQRGRPKLTATETNERYEMVLLKLEPYIKSGLSVNKALKETGIANSVFYRMYEDPIFREKIDLFRQYISVLVNHVLVKNLYAVVEKQNAGKELDDTDIEFLQWFALHHNTTQEEYGKRNVNSYSPEEDLQKIPGLVSTDIEKIQHLQNIVDNL